jgi:hypothetical protein
MEKLFRDTLNILEKINALLPEPIITQQDIIEEQENIEEHADLINEIITLIRNMNHADLNNKKNINYYLIHLHINYLSMIWHIEQMHNLIIKTMCAYPDDSPLDESTKAYENFCIQERLKRKEINKLDTLLTEITKTLEKLNTIFISPIPSETTISRDKNLVESFVQARQRLVSLIDDMQDHLHDE